MTVKIQKNKIVINDFQHYWQSATEHGHEFTFAYGKEFKNSKKEGSGKYYYTNGYIYEGDFKSNKPHGKGQIFGKDGEVVYKGEFKNNKKHGKGELVIGDSIGDKYFLSGKI